MEDFVVVSKVRRGHKREFAFAVKSQNEIAASLGRTRTRKPPIGIQHSPIRRLKKQGKGENGRESEAEEMKGNSVILSDSSDVEWTEDVADEEELMDLDCLRDGGNGGDDEVKMKVVRMGLKDLLRTGLLEGLRVHYKRKSKSTGISGVVRGFGIKCNCESCKGVTDIFSPLKFEEHAGSRNKHPAENIFMPNGKTFRDVLNACNVCEAEDMEAMILKACGLRAEDNSSNESISVSGVSEQISKSANEDYEKMSKTKASETEEPLERASNPLGSTLQKRLTVSGVSEKISESANEDYEKMSKTKASETEEPLERASSPLGSTLQKRLTHKHRRRNKRVLENDNVLPEGTPLIYKFHDEVWLSGFKRGARIVCECCQKEVTPSQFEAHAGWASHKQPYHHICTTDGKSLFTLAKSLPEKHDEHDEVCNICQNEGYSISCSGCPRVFHKECLHLQNAPNHVWYCRLCHDKSNKVYGNKNSNAIEDGFDAKQRRLMRLAEPKKSAEPDRGGCVLCRCHDFVKGGFYPRTIIICDQCEREYHVQCLRDYGMQDLKEVPPGKWFCCHDCDKIHYTIQQRMEEGGMKIPDSLLNLIMTKHTEKASNDVKLDVEWRLLSCDESVKQLSSDAISIFHEQFSPIVIPGSEIDLIPCMVSGGKNLEDIDPGKKKNLDEKDFRGMYCAVLTVNSQVISAAVFRVYGTEIAELPLVATAKYYEKLGFFQALYFCIENLLSEMEVKHLSLPATNEAKPMWIKKLGFSKFPQDELGAVERWYQLMPFEGTSMLRKAVPAGSWMKEG